MKFGKEQYYCTFNRVGIYYTVISIHINRIFKRRTKSKSQEPTCHQRLFELILVAGLSDWLRCCSFNLLKTAMN